MAVNPETRLAAARPQARLARRALRQGARARPQPLLPDRPRVGPPAAPARRQGRHRSERDRDEGAGVLAEAGQVRRRRWWRAGSRPAAAPRSGPLVARATSIRPSCPGPGWVRLRPRLVGHLRLRPRHHRRHLVALVRADRVVPVHARPRGRGRPRRRQPRRRRARPQLRRPRHRPGLRAVRRRPHQPLRAHRLRRPRARPAVRVLREHRRRLVDADGRPREPARRRARRPVRRGGGAGRAHRLRGARRRARSTPAQVALIGSGTLGLLTIAALRQARPDGRAHRHRQAPAPARRWPPSSAPTSWSRPASSSGPCGAGTGLDALRQRPARRRGRRRSSTASARRSRIAQALRIAAPGGTIHAVGMPGVTTVDLTPLWQREVALRGAYAYQRARLRRRHRARRERSTSAASCQRHLPPAPLRGRHRPRRRRPAPAAPSRSPSTSGRNERETPSDAPSWVRPRGRPLDPADPLPPRRGVPAREAARRPQPRPLPGRAARRRSTTPTPPSATPSTTRSATPRRCARCSSRA